MCIPPFSLFVSMRGSFSYTARWTQRSDVTYQIDIKIGVEGKEWERADYITALPETLCFWTNIQAAHEYFTKGRNTQAQQKP